MSDGDWYEVVHGDDLRQGDLLIDCPVFTLSGEAGYPLPPDYEPVIQTESYDLVIMTQSCDLDNNKIEERIAVQCIFGGIAWQDHHRRIPHLVQQR